MMRKLLLAFVLAFAGLLFYANAQPDEFRFERSVQIGAPPERVFAFLGDFRRWTAWSPWETKDPAMTREYGTATAGPGGTYAWAGNSDVGVGRMTITESIPAAQLVIDLEFSEPMDSRSVVEFALEPTDDGGTTVTWSMNGPMNFFSKLVGVFMDTESMVGPDFDSGLAKLKAAAEAGGD